VRSRTFVCSNRLCLVSLSLTVERNRTPTDRHPFNNDLAIHLHLCLSLSLSLSLSTLSSSSSPSSASHTHPHHTSGVVTLFHYRQLIIVAFKPNSTTKHHNRRSLLYCQAQATSAPSSFLSVASTWPLYQLLSQSSAVPSVHLLLHCHSLAANRLECLSPKRFVLESPPNAIVSLSLSLSHQLTPF
jgi:hypothetical protein